MNDSEHSVSVTRTAERGGLPGDFRIVADKIRAAGLLRRSRAFYISLLVVLGLAMVAVTTGMALIGQSWWQLGFAAALGVVFAQVGFVAHEASHRQVFASGRANDRLGRILTAGVVGISHQWWVRKHSKHHGNPNRVGHDPDIAFDAVSFRPEDAATRRGLLRWITARQGWLFFPLLLLEGINLHVTSIKGLCERRPIPGRWLELGMIAARFAVVAGLVFSLLPFGMALAFFGVQLAVFGLVMGASFAPNHKGMPLVGQDERLDFFTKQVRTSRNIRGWWATALMGGLNHQIEHHLFPSMARPHLAAAGRIVREHCRAIGAPYTETGLFEAYGIVVRHLNQVGLAARDPYECPMLTQRN